MKEGDICPKCEKGILKLIIADDPNDIYPNGGRYEDYLYCEICDNTFEIL